ncbi:MAG: DUF4055 domain-containing protein, partial [Rhodothermales bacterium]
PKTDPSQTTAAYNAYRDRAVWFNATKRSIQGFQGMLWRKPAAITPDDELDRGVTGDGHSLDWLLREATREVLTVSRAGVLVDRPDFVRDDGLEPSRADVERAGVRPYMRLFTAENIWDWDTEIISGREVLSYLKLYETDSRRDRERRRVAIERVRELYLEDGRHHHVVHERETGGKWVILEDRTPAAFPDQIPFWFLDPVAGTPDVDIPVLLDLVDLNLSHYRTMADLEHGRHFTALPTPWATGVEIDEIRLGPESGLNSSSPNAQFGILEFTGSGLSSLETAAKSKEDQMALLGARMLMAERRQAEAAETAQIHRAGEDSILASIARSVSESAGEAYRAYRRAAGASEEASVELNTDFVATQMSAQMLQALLSAWQQGGIAFEDLVQQLKSGEIVRADRSADDIMQDRADEPEPMGASGGSEGLGGLFG